MRKRVSLKDIAKKLDVSPTTVSFVLNGKGKEKKISDVVIEKIKKYSEEINYRPNRVAQNLRTGNSKILVFMVEDISNPFFAKIARIIEDLAFKKGYKVLFCSTENNDNKSREFIELFNERMVDGYIIIPSPGIKDDIEALIRDDVPVVLFDRYFPELNTSHVVIDNEKASFRATNHLIQNGYKKIGFVTINVEQNQILNRELGYTTAMEESSLRPNVLKITYGATHTTDAKRAIRDFIDSSDVDALFFSTNYLTLTGLQVMKESKGNDKSRNIGIVTFDDNDIYEILTPTITVLAQPLKQIAQELMRIMLNNLSRPKNSVRPVIQVELPAKLIIRESSLTKGKLSLPLNTEEAPGVK